METTKSTILQITGAAAAVLLVGSCGPGEPVPQPELPTSTESSTQPSASGTASVPTTQIPESSPTEDLDTSDWKEFTAHGLRFSYPANWAVSAEDCDHCEPGEDPLENPYAEWEITNDQGLALIDFQANSAEDTGGDMKSYQRTVIGQDKLPAQMAQPVILLAEQRVETEAGEGTERDEKFTVMLINEELSKSRDENPALAYFTPDPEVYATMETTDGLPQWVGIDDDEVRVEHARQIVDSEAYQIIRAIMLSVERTESGE